MFSIITCKGSNIFYHDKFSSKKITNLTFPTVQA